MSIKKDIVFRIVLVYLAVLGFAFAILFQIIKLQFIEGEQLRSQAKTIKPSLVPARRGDILDRNGKVLATSVPFYHVYFDPRIEAFKKSDKLFKDSVKALAAGLSRIFDEGSREATNQYYNKLVKAYSVKDKPGAGVVLIKRNITFPELKKLSALPIFNRGPYKGGLTVETEEKRVKPYKELAYRTVGYMYENASNEKVGMIGLEKAYEVELRGEKGVKYSGNATSGNDATYNVFPKDGYDLVSTLDVDIQDIAHTTLIEFIKEIEARYGCAVVMDVKTGDILAIANIGKNTNGDYTETFNYAIGRRAEPGSTFKVVSMMVALDDGVVDPNDKVETGTGVVKYYDKKVTDWNADRGGNGTITAKEVIKYSSNVGISKIIYENYNTRKTDFVDRIYSMNLNKPLGIEIKGEVAPLIKYPTDKSWSGITLTQMAYGYEVELTPLQILTYYNAIANNGVMVKPRFVKALVDKHQIVKEFDVEVINPAICQEKTINQIKEMLESVVEDKGTADDIASPFYKIAGKTGTAQIAINNKSYSHEGKKYHRGSFCGYFPADNPKYSCVVVIDSSAQVQAVSGHKVAELFRVIADKIYANDIELQAEYSKKLEKVQTPGVPFVRSGNRDELLSVLNELDIKYNDKTSNAEWATTNENGNVLILENKSIKENQVPNVKGMGVRDAVFLLEQLGLNVEVKGYGVVKSQSLEPGQMFKVGERIVIVLG